MKRSGPPKRRTPLAHGNTRLRRTPLAGVSKKRRGERDRRRDVVAQVIARDGERCKGADRAPHIECRGPLDADEYDLRSARPGGHLDPDNVQMLCREHHEWKHQFPWSAGVAGLRPLPGSGERRMLG